MGLQLSISKIYAHISCTELTKSSKWYGKLFGRESDASPMDSLQEWHHGNTTGVQLFEDPDAAGKSTVTIIVSDLDSDRQSLVERGLEPGAIETGDSVRIVCLNDPDGNLVVLAQPSSD